MKEEIIKMLEPLMHKPCFYSGSTITLTKYHFDEVRERVFLFFKERGPMDRPIESADKLIEQFVLIDESNASLYSMMSVPPETITIEETKDKISTTKPDVAPPMNAAKKQQEIIPYLDNSAILKRASEILLQDIDDIKTGEITIEKAEARGKNVGMIIEIEKTKVSTAAVAVKFLPNRL